MDLRFTDEDEAFRREVAEFLERELGGAFAAVRGRGGPGDEGALVEERKAWERRLGEAGWIGLSWPRSLGGRELPLLRQVIFYEEYARAGGPGRIDHMGENLVAPTLIAFGSEEQKRRFLPPIRAGEVIWCQGYSEPNAGSDLANVQTRARLEGDEWVIDGQKVWTSWAEFADWCFVVARCDPDSQRHKGLVYLLVPMHQPGIELRPILQMTGDSEFCETFFDGARTAKENVVGAPGDWTYLRIVKETVQGEERYTAYTSTDGERWVRGGAWTHQLGAAARLGLVSMGGSGFTAHFDYVRVNRVH